MFELISELLQHQKPKTFEHLWSFPSVCIMHVWIYSTCCCISVSARVYQSGLTSSLALTERSCQRARCGSRVSGCSGRQARPMPTNEHTHTDKHRLLRARLHGTAAASSGQARPQSLTSIRASPHSPKMNPQSDQSASSTNTHRKPKHRECYGLHYQVRFHVSAAT